jgi:hypothetical protein
MATPRIKRRLIMFPIPKNLKRRKRVTAAAEMSPLLWLMKMIEKEKRRHQKSKTKNTNIVREAGRVK